MKMLFAMISTLILSGCVTAQYQSTDDTEEFKLTSFMKSVDGLNARRADFLLDIDSTHSQDPMPAMLEMLRLMYQMQNIQD